MCSTKCTVWMRHKLRIVPRFKKVLIIQTSADGYISETVVGTALKRRKDSSEKLDLSHPQFPTPPFRGNTWSLLLIHRTVLNSSKMKLGTCASTTYSKQEATVRRDWGSFTRSVHPLTSVSDLPLQHTTRSTWSTPALGRAAGCSCSKEGRACQDSRKGHPGWAQRFCVGLEGHRHWHWHWHPPCCSTTEHPAQVGPGTGTRYIAARLTQGPSLHCTVGWEEEGNWKNLSLGREYWRGSGLLHNHWGTAYSKQDNDLRPHTNNIPSSNAVKLHLTLKQSLSTSPDSQNFPCMWNKDAAWAATLWQERKGRKSRTGNGISLKFKFAN